MSAKSKTESLEDSLATLLIESVQAGKDMKLEEFIEMSVNLSRKRYYERYPAIPPIVVESCLEILKVGMRKSLTEGISKEVLSQGLFDPNFKCSPEEGEKMIEQITFLSKVVSEAMKEMFSNNVVGKN